MYRTESISKDQNMQAIRARRVFDNSIRMTLDRPAMQIECVHLTV
jgi:hypothetical protein